MHWIQTELRVLVLFSFKEKNGVFFEKKKLKIETRSWSFSCTLYVQKEQEPSAKEWLLSGDVKATFRAQVLHILKMGGHSVENHAFAHVVVYTKLLSSNMIKTTKWQICIFQSIYRLLVKVTCKVIRWA